MDRLIQVTDQQAIFDAIKRERDYQDEKWGSPLVNPHEIPAWLMIMRRELNEAMDEWTRRKGKTANQEALKEILQVIAVGVACLEQHGVIERDD